MRQQALWSSPALALVWATGVAVASERGFPELVATGEAYCATPSPAVPAAGQWRPPTPPETILLPDDNDLQTQQWVNIVVDPVSVPIPFVVPEGAAGVVLRAEAPTDEFDIAVELVGPMGNRLVCFDCRDTPAVGEVREGRGSAQVPSSDRAGWELEPGTHWFHVRAIPNGTGPVNRTTVNVTASIRSDLAAQVEHFLDLNFVYLPGSSLSAATTPSDPQFQALLTETDARLAPTGIRIGNVTHNDLDRPEFSIVATWEEAGRMFKTSAAVGRTRALNVYCVQKFEAPLNPVVGLSGGIPGPSWNGSRDSGVAMRTDSFATCPTCVPAFASLLAHEIGHYIGFYHTTEANLLKADPFSDTPRCNDPNDLRQCPDWEYVMFPVIHPANSVWSEAQGRTAPTHPLIRAVPVPSPAPARTDVRAVAAPNPFRETVTFEMPGLARFDADVFDVHGRRVRTVAGSGGIVTWDGADAIGRPVPAGIYFVRFQNGNRRESLRVVKVP